MSPIQIVSDTRDGKDRHQKKERRDRKEGGGGCD